ncbi:MAG: glycosyltransferase, partial [Lachnospiraceae bacterium]
AMSYGLASVATNVGGVPEIVSEGEGILIPAGDEKALAAALEKVLADAEYRRELGIAARARIAGDYDMKGAVDRLCEVYSEIETL